MRPTLSRALIGHPRYALSCVIRVAIIWAAVRVVALLGGRVIEGGAAMAAFALIVCAVVLLDAAATRELTYMRNLGLPARWLVVSSALVVILLEILVQAIVA